MVTQHEVIEGKALAPTTSVQKAKLIALLRALELPEGKTIHMWTEPKFALCSCPLGRMEGKGIINFSGVPYNMDK